MAKTQRIFEPQPCCQSSSGQPSSVFCPFSAKKGRKKRAWCLVLAMPE